MMIYLRCDAQQHWLECIPLSAILKNLIKEAARNQTTQTFLTEPPACACMFSPSNHRPRFHIVSLHVTLTCELNKMKSFFCSHFFLMASMSSLCCLKMQSMKVLPRHPLKVTANLSRATLSRSVKSKNRAHISWSHVVLVLAPVCVCARAPNIQKIYWNMYEPHDACTKNTLK